MEEITSSQLLFIYQKSLLPSYYYFVHCSIENNVKATFTGRLLDVFLRLLNVFYEFERTYLEM